MDIRSRTKRGARWLWDKLPVAALILLASLFVGKEIVDPHRRMVKTTVAMLVIILMIRFDMIYSLCLFFVLFPYPSGITLGSTNLLLPTLILLLWLIRARSQEVPVFYSTPADKAILLFLIANVVSFFNLNPMFMSDSLKMLWRQLAAIALFYMIVRFATDERRLSLLIRTLCVSGALVTVTGIIQVIAPGMVLIPGWVDLGDIAGKGLLSFRLEGLRLSGAIGGHNVLADLSVVSLFLMAFLMLTRRNVLEKILWAIAAAATLAVLVGTANRGGFTILTMGLVYVFFVYGKRISLMRRLTVVASFIGMVAVADLVMTRYTVAVSVLDRLLETKFQGVVPDTRVSAWGPALAKAMEHVFIGQGPFFDLGAGLERLFWPHNAYLYYLYSFGIFGLGAFLWILWSLFRASLLYRHRRIAGTSLGDALGILHVLFVVISVGQFRTDHQRNGDFVYMFLIWILYGLLAAAHHIAQERVRGDELIGAAEGSPEDGVRKPDSTFAPVGRQA